MRLPPADYVKGRCTKMEKSRFDELRRDYRLLCKGAWLQYLELAGDGFYPSDEAVEAYDLYWRFLHEFAAAVGCTVPVAADILNLRKMEG